MVKNIMESKDDEKSFEFWASSCFCMNDIAEFTTGYDVLKGILNSFEDTIEYKLRLSILEEQTSIVGKTPDYISSLIKSNTVIMERMPYVISFSFMPDYLPMWYMYAERGEGVCMGFEMDEIEETERKVWPVIYDYEKSQKEYKEGIRYMIKDIYSDYLVRVESIKDDINKLWDEKMTTIRYMCTLLAPIFKHPAYEFENEYRLVQYGSKERVEYRQTEKGTVISYIIIKIPFHTLKKVIVGPCADRRVFHSLNNELKSCNPRHLVEIEPSVLPFRII